MARFACASFLVLIASFTSLTASAQEQPTPPPPPESTTPPPPPVTPPAPATTPVPGPTPQQTEARRVHATIDAGDKNAVIERRITTEESNGRMLFAVPFRATSETWEQVCVAPCTVDLDRYSSYRVGKANNVQSTSTFTLPPSSDQLRLRVETGSLFTHHLATRLIALGTAAAIVGGAMITTASSFDRDPSEKNVRLGGIITAGTGVILLGIGIPLALISQTHVKLDDNRQIATSKPNKPRLTVSGLVF